MNSQVLTDVYLERVRQDEKWGEQNHPDGTLLTGDVARADSARALCDFADSTGDLTWRDILTEEFMEALAESDPVALRTELVQVASVAVAWVEAIDRRAGRDRRI